MSPFVKLPHQIFKMEKNLQQTAYKFNVWTDDYIIPNSMNFNNNHHLSSSSPKFILQLRVQEFLKYLPEREDSIVEEPRGPFTVKTFCLSSVAVIQEDDAADNTMYEILRSVGVPGSNMLPIIQGVSSFARNMMSQLSNSSRPLIPILVGIAVTKWDPRDEAMALQREKFGRRPEIEEEEKPLEKRQRKYERQCKICLTPYLGIRYRVEV